MKEPAPTGRTIGGHASHTGGCWLMIVGIAIAAAIIIIRACAR